MKINGRLVIHFKGFGSNKLTLFEKKPLKENKSTLPFFFPSLDINTYTILSKNLSISLIGSLGNTGRARRRFMDDKIEPHSSIRTVHVYKNHARKKGPRMSIRTTLVNKDRACQ